MSVMAERDDSKKLEGEEKKKKELRWLAARHKQMELISKGDALRRLMVANFASRSRSQ